MRYSFITAAAKHLSLVEIDAWASNQHEFNGVSALRKMFGNSKCLFNVDFVYYNETGEVIHECGNVTWYDARLENPTRTEYRLYYSQNNVVKQANVNDLLIVGKKVDNTLSIIIAKNGCRCYNLFMDRFRLNYINTSYEISDRISVNL